jgi:hypothetical protein
MERVKNYFRKLKKVVRNKYFLLIAAVLIVVGGVIVYIELTKPVEKPVEIKSEKKVEPVDTRVPSKLMGIKVDPSELNKKIMTVVIENHPDARPQSGLDKASIVYETLAEGGITRFLAVFQENEVAEIGPVRSARIYFLDWALEYDALFAHVGGNIAALDAIGPLKIQDLNQFFNANYFWRDNSRYAPHNVYTTTEKLRAGGEKAKYSSSSNFPGMSFKEDNKIDLRPQTAVFTVDFSGGSYNPTYTYDRNNNVWLRSQEGVAFKDKKSGAQIAPKNVIVEFTGFSYGKSRDGAQLTTIKTTGSGRALFYIDGEQIEGTWEKAAKSSKTVFKDTLGNEIKLNTGQTWIEVVPQGNGVNYSKT